MEEPIAGRERDTCALPLHDAEPEDVTTSDLAYVCPVCGLELKVEVATTDRAPTHCREKMELVDRSKPPLRPV